MDGVPQGTVTPGTETLPCGDRSFRASPVAGPFPRHPQFPQCGASGPSGARPAAPFSLWKCFALRSRKRRELGRALPRWRRRRCECECGGKGREGMGRDGARRGARGRAVLWRSLTRRVPQAGVWRCGGAAGGSLRTGPGHPEQERPLRCKALRRARGEPCGGPAPGLRGSGGFGVARAGTPLG